MVLIKEVCAFSSFDKLERISKWLNELPVTKEHDQVQWDTNVFSFCSNNLHDGDDTEQSFSISDCSDSDCSECIYNRISHIEDSTDNDSVFTDNLEAHKEKKLKAIRERQISNVSVRIQGRTVEKVCWSTKDSDLLLNIEDRLFPVHRSILSKHSEVLKVILEKHYDELMLQIHENADQVRLVLEHIYGFKIEVNFGNYENILKLSQKLNVHSLETQCRHFHQLNSKQEKLGLNLQKTLNKISGLFFMR